MSVQRIWKNAKDEVPGRLRQNLLDIDNMLEDFRSKGLDPDDDATYALLDPDSDPAPTKADFDRVHVRLLMLGVIDLYHRAQKKPDEYLGEEATQRYLDLKQLVETDMPAFIEKMKEAGKPETSGILEAWEFGFIVSLHAQGALADELKLAALEAAKEQFRNALVNNTNITLGPQEGVKAAAKAGLAFIEDALELIEEAGEFYKAAEIPVDEDGQGGWEDEAVIFSRQHLKALKTKFGLIIEGRELAAAREGHIRQQAAAYRP